MDVEERISKLEGIFEEYESIRSGHEAYLKAEKTLQELREEKGNQQLYLPGCTSLWGLLQEPEEKQRTRRAQTRLAELEPLIQGAEKDLAQYSEIRSRAHDLERKYIENLIVLLPGEELQEYSAERVLLDG